MDSHCRPPPRTSFEAPCARSSRSPGRPPVRPMCVASEHSTYSLDSSSAPWVDSKHSTYLPDPSSVPCCALRGKFSTERLLAAHTAVRTAHSSTQTAHLAVPMIVPISGS
ncbi:hypothetical protein PR001_g26824 [Phytophthora rubi]|uniref:Uncharacterized protein n=1 Tax=Phytophthora rubi TaxID=129364 RepID=A0A6A3HPT3_9STRA|nr:hypothetical protein PR001_g26824 [Phytophthora rubi]